MPQVQVLVSTQTGERTRLACRFRRRAETFCPTQIRPARRRTKQPGRLRSPFPPSAIIKRPPLSATARRAGWIGCNFALNRIPVEARIAVVTTIMSPSPPSPTGESGRGEVARIKSPRPDSLPALRGEGNVFWTVIVPPEEVREKFKRVKPLKEISVKQRGWTLDVLNAIRRLGKSAFTTADAYAFARDLEKLHPDNPVNYAVTRGRPARQG